MHHHGYFFLLDTDEASSNEDDDKSLENVDTLINSAGAGPSQPRTDAPRVTTLPSHESAATNVDELERQPEAVQAEFGQAETVQSEQGDPTEFESVYPQ